MHDKITTKEEFAEIVQIHFSQISTEVLQFADWLNADFLFLAAIDQQKALAESLVTAVNGELAENVVYDLMGSPCEQVAGQYACVYEQDVGRLFPADPLLEKMGVEAYMGVPVTSMDGAAIAILVCLFKSPTSLSSLQHPMVLFAAYLSSLCNSYYVTSELSSKLELLNELGNITKAGAWEYEVDSGKLSWSKQVYDIHGVAENIQPTPGLSIKHYAPKDSEHIRELLETAILSGKDYQAECQFVDANGQGKWIRTSGRPRKNEQGNVVSIYGAFEDISHEKSLLLGVQSEREYLSTLLNSISEAVITLSEDGSIVDANKSASTIFGYSKQAFRHLSFDALMPQPHAGRYRRYVEEHFATKKEVILGTARQLPGLRENHEMFQMELLLTEMMFHDKLQYVAIIRDISERIQAQDSIYKAAYTNRLTGLKNRSWFEKEIRDLMAKSANKTWWLYCALVDIDKLSHFNLRYGFGGGDRIIKQVATKLQESCKGHFKIYQNGIDSFFVVLLQKADEDTGFFPEREAFEYKLLRPMQYALFFDHVQEIPSVSLGSLVSQVSSLNYADLIHRIEFASKQAKKQAPKGLYFMGPAQQALFERTKRIRELVGRITELQELDLVLQPQFTSPEQFSSSEALIRWHSKELGFVSPAEFIPLAEESEAIIAIGDWVIRRVCQLLHEMRTHGVDTQISINVSGRQIIHNDFASKLLTITREYEIPPQSLMLELTETTLVSDIAQVRETMQALNEVGFRFSIDDFGTGYSSLNYLKELPIAELKIDKCFVDEIVDSRSKATIVDVIINMSQALNVKSIAEGVEHESQYHYLKSKGCDLLQGYWFSKPLSIAAWTEQLLAVPQS